MTHLGGSSGIVSGNLCRIYQNYDSLLLKKNGTQSRQDATDKESAVASSIGEPVSASKYG